MNQPYDPHADPLNDWIDARHNGSDPPMAPLTDPDLADLFATADQLDHLARTSEQHALLNRPPVTSWEHVMYAQPIAPGMASPPAAGRTSRLPAASRRGSASGIRPATPVQWLLAVGLCAVLLMGSYAVYVGRYGGNGPSPTEEPPLALAAQDLESTPQWVPESPLSTAECTLEARSQEELAELQRNPVVGEAREYFPTSPASADDALAIADASRLAEACGMAGNRQAMESERLISFGQQDSIARNSRTFEEYVSNSRALARLLLPPGRDDFRIASDQSVPLDAEATPSATDEWEASYYEVVQPQDVVVFPDGRMGGPASWVVPANLNEIIAAEPGQVEEYLPALVEYQIFAQEDGRWVLDEWFALCVHDCEHWFEYEAEGWYLQARSIVVPATPIVLPTISATPEAVVPGSAARGSASAAVR